MKALSALLVAVAMTLGGCSWWEGKVVRSQSPDEPDAGQADARLVGDLAVPFGMFPVKVEGVSLVTELHDTGSDPAPSPQRQVLLGTMQTLGVESPNAVLASPKTAMVLVRGVLPPGIQKGDRFDIEVRTPSRSETTSLREGWLLETELKELAVLNNQIHGGHPLGTASGPVMVDPSADGKNDRVLMNRGRVLGGGVALKSRPLALVLKPEHQSVLNSARIETAVNKRFHGMHKGTKVGVAKAKTDEYIELQVHPTYKDNIQRYVQVVRAIALRESEKERQTRLARLRRQLVDPISSSRAALQLEAIGPGAVDVLRTGIDATDPEVRFYSAEALAYLGRREAAEPLADAARSQPAFRVFALAALSSMDELSAADHLRELLNGTSAETRYGAFRALWAMNPHDPMVAGEELGEQFSYHVLDTSGTPMIHVTRSRRPEVVLFGRDQRLKTPLMLDAGSRIMIVGNKPDEIAVSKFAVGQMDQKRIVSNRIDDVIRAIVELGGTYPDVVQALQEAKRKDLLSGRFEVDAVPEAGRRYDRLAAGQSEATVSTVTHVEADSPEPELYTNVGEERPSKDRGNRGKLGKTEGKHPDSADGPHPVKTFFAKMIPGSSP